MEKNKIREVIEKQRREFEFVPVVTRKDKEFPVSREKQIEFFVKSQEELLKAVIEEIEELILRREDGSLDENEWIPSKELDILKTKLQQPINKDKD